MAAGVPVPFSTVGFTAREELLSSDVNRLQNLRSREVQDLLADESRTDESRSGSTPQNGRGSRTNTASVLPLLTFSSAFQMTLSYGQVFLQDNTIATDVTSGGDDSQYQVVRFQSQICGFTTPDASNPRIDLVVATPTVVPADSASRNVIVDPVTRSISALAVNKTNNPGTNIQIVAGTPDPQPVAPALPAGAVALFEVYVPPGAADASTFSVSRRIWRRGAASVAPTMHGILRGCPLIWDTVDETTVSAGLSIGLSATAPSRVVIDGEVLSFSSLASSGPAALAGVTQDAAANNPFAAAAPATTDKVYYLYLCGGKNLPQGRRTTLSGNGLQPVCLVESLVAPDRNGRPLANITTPRGTTREGALYVGVGYVVMNSTRRKGCYVAGDWVYALTGAVALGGLSMAAFNEFYDRKAALSGAAGTDHLLNSKPSLADQALVTAVVTNSGGTLGYFAVGQTMGALDTTGEGVVVTSIASGIVPQRVDFLAQPAGGSLRASIVTGLSSFNNFYMWARGWNMRVPRYAA